MTPTSLVLTFLLGDGPASLIARVVRYVVMAVTPEKTTAPEIAALRTYAAAAGVPMGGITDEALERLVERTKGDHDFALIALKLKPRPGWVTAILI